MFSGMDLLACQVGCEAKMAKGSIATEEQQQMEKKVTSNMCLDILKAIKLQSNM